MRDQPQTDESMGKGRQPAAAGAGGEPADSGRAGATPEKQQAGRPGSGQPRDLRTLRQAATGVVAADKP